MRSNGVSEELSSIGVHPTSASLTFGSKDFRLIRFLLRLMSLWRPRSAGCIERIVYPVTVNLILLSAGLVRNIMQATHKPTWLSIQSLYIIHEFGIWLGHILANLYFNSRDLETNVLQPDQPLPEMERPLRHKLRYLNCAMVASLLVFSLMLCTLFVASQFKWNHGAKRFSSDVMFLHGTPDHIFYVVVILSIIYDLGIGLALAWTMSLLYLCFASRLKALEVVLLQWQESTVNAIYFFQLVYSRSVKKSWKKISWWFLAHNVIALAIPLYGYELAQAIQGMAYHSKHLAQFICYLVFVLTLWLTPIVMAEQIKRREKIFAERINNFCPGLLREIKVRAPLRVSVSDMRDRLSETASLISAGSTQEEAQDNFHDENFTFVLRGKELRNFLRFLKKRQPGLVSHGYSLQLNVSLISLVCGIVSFLIELQDGNGSVHVTSGKHSNETFF